MLTERQKKLVERFAAENTVDTLAPHFIVLLDVGADYEMFCKVKASAQRLGMISTFESDRANILLTNMTEHG